MTPQSDPETAHDQPRDPDDRATDAPMPSAPSARQPGFDRLDRDPDEGPGLAGGSSLGADDDAADEEVGGGD